MSLAPHRHGLLEHGDRLVQVSLVEKIQPELFEAVRNIRVGRAEDGATDIERLPY